MDVHIYTDGSMVKKNPGPGGWAAVIVMGEGEGVRERIITGFDPDTSNVRMEMTAVLEGLRFFKTNRCRNIRIHTDYENIVKMFKLGWVDKWAANNWRKTNDRMVKNRDLVEKISNASIRHNITWVHVKGHTGDHYNEMAHDAAYAAAQRGWEEYQEQQQVTGLPSKVSVLPPKTLGEIKEEELPELPPLPPIPDPPVIERREYWAVWERETKTRFRPGPRVWPVSPSESDDAKRREMIQAAIKMNNAKDDPSAPLEDGQTLKPTKTRVGGLPRFEALPFYWMCDRNFHATVQEIQEIQMEDKDGTAADRSTEPILGGTVVHLNDRRSGRLTIPTDGESVG